MERPSEPTLYGTLLAVRDISIGFVILNGVFSILDDKRPLALNRKQTFAAIRVQRSGHYYRGEKGDGSEKYSKAHEEESQRARKDRLLVLVLVPAQGPN